MAYKLSFDRSPAVRLDRSDRRADVDLWRKLVMSWPEVHEGDWLPEGSVVHVFEGRDGTRRAFLQPRGDENGCERT